MRDMTWPCGVGCASAYQGRYFVGAVEVLCETRTRRGCRHTSEGPAPFCAVCTYCTYIPRYPDVSIFWRGMHACSPRCSANGGVFCPSTREAPSRFCVVHTCFTSLCISSFPTLEGYGCTHTTMFSERLRCLCPSLLQRTTSLRCDNLRERITKHESEGRWRYIL